MKDSVIVDKRKELMTKEEMAFLENHTSKFITEVSAAASLRIDRMVLNRLLLKYKGGLPTTCGPHTAKIIRKEIKKLGYKAE